MPSYNAACDTSPNGSQTSSLLQVREKQAQRSGQNSYHPVSSYRPMPVVDNIDRHIYDLSIRLELLPPVQGHYIVIVVVVIIVVLQHITQPKVASFRHYLRSNNHAIDSINSFTYFLLASICGIINQNPCGKPGYTFIFVGIPYSVRNTFS